MTTETATRNQAHPREDRAARYRSVRSVLETPIMDERKWAKVPSIPADMMLLDLEDAVPPGLKEQARERVVRYVRDSSYLGDKLTLARPNHLSTPWGAEDLAALGESGVTCMAYPKLRSIEELLEVLELLESYDARPDIYAIVETAGAMMDLREISRHPQVVSLMFGPGDLSVDIGLPLMEPDGRLNRVFDAMKSQVVLAAASARIGVTDIVFAPDFRDLAEIRNRAEISRMLGFTALSTFYPPHVEIINDVFTPSHEELADARATVELYGAVLAEGKAAALTERGETILIHDYEKALSLLAKAR
jgi:citrate lyase beta subunit